MIEYAFAAARPGELVFQRVSPGLMVPSAARRAPLEPRGLPQRDPPRLGSLRPAGAAIDAPGRCAPRGPFSRRVAL